MLKTKKNTLRASAHQQIVNTNIFTNILATNIDIELLQLVVVFLCIISGAKINKHIFFNNTLYFSASISCKIPFAVKITAHAKSNNGKMRK